MKHHGRLPRLLRISSKKPTRASVDIRPTSSVPRSSPLSSTLRTLFERTKSGLQPKKNTPSHTKGATEPRADVGPPLWLTRYTVDSHLQMEFLHARDQESKKEKLHWPEGPSKQWTYHLAPTLGSTILDRLLQERHHRNRQALRTLLLVLCFCLCVVLF